MTKQETFDKVVAHLVKQGKRAITDNDLCCYRADNGTLACAIGCLIPDDLYTPDIEGPEVFTLMNMTTPLGDYMRRTFINHESLFPMLQSVHDDSMNWDKTGLSVLGWQRLESIAYLEGLTMPDRPQS